ncbi:MAG TPA: AAA family ATPase [Candidatus Paceibacterota bacterium]|nr:AAA family ATPase [Candidatus Paceibacterota bacterium]
MTQNEALNILKTGANAFLTGEPGSGKTHTVNAYVEWLRSHDIEPAITASTGIAATHVGGMTIHAWSGIGIREYLSASDLDAISSKEHIVRRLNKTAVLIIDEVSMLSGEVLSMVDQVLREVRHSERAFGGVQVVLVGDFFQLPPVSKASREASFAFQSDAWRRLNPIPLYLEEQHRQEDAKFGGILASIRSGTFDHTDMSHISSRQTEPEDAGDIPRLYTHNADVDRINAEKLASIPGSGKGFLMDTSGAPTLIESLKRGCLSPERLELKVGAVVMFTKNNPLAGFANGTLGVVAGFENGTGYPVVELRDGRRIAVAPQEWVVEENGKVRAKLTQVPLRLAWAITIHKSQGASMDAAMIDLSRAFEYGQGYVALSRLRTLEGLYLLGWNENALAIHPAVRSVDERFREASGEAAAVFNSLEETGERRVLEENFLTASGGSLEVIDTDAPRGEKPTTYDETYMLLKEGKTLEEVVKARELTFGTIVSHLEKLSEAGKLSTEQVRALASKRLIDGLGAISEAAGNKSFKALTPVFKKLKGKYTFDEIRLARLILAE